MSAAGMFYVLTRCPLDESMPSCRRRVAWVCHMCCCTTTNKISGGKSCSWRTTFNFFFPACFWTSGPRLAVKCQAWQPTSHDSNIILPFFSFQEESKSKNRFEKNKEEYDEQQVEGREGDMEGGKDRREKRRCHRRYFHSHCRQNR